MKKLFFALTLLIAPIFLDAKTYPPKHYLQKKIPKKNFRYSTFYNALELMQKRKVKTIVETGTSRCGSKNYEGDGGSTIIFSEWAKDYKAQFYSVDVNLSYLAEAKAAVHKHLGKVSDRLHFICSDSIAFLQNFNQQIDFLYLDSYDFEADNPLPSQCHHLYEIQAAYPYLTKDSIVMIDDCGLPHGGKGKLAIEYLLEHGWQIFQNAYQVILIYPH